MDDDKLNGALEGVDESKRSTLKRLIGTGAFVGPIIASFTMAGLSVDGYLHSAAAASNASDRRLKKGIIRVATHPDGFGLYRFSYLWSETEYVGVLAQEVLPIRPDAVVGEDDGLLRVNYAALGMKMLPYAAWQSQTEARLQAIAA